MTKSDIKFRGFIHKHKEMVSFEQLKEWGTNFSAFEDDESIVFEQYTGLKDVNGVEIYEGDIVKLHVIVLSPEDKIGVVKYDTTYGYSLYFTDKSVGRVARQEYWANNEKTNYEVIGNVHMNPELLEVE